MKTNIKAYYLQETLCVPFDDSFPVLAATVTKPNIRRKTNPDNPNVFYRKAFLANKGCGTPFSSTRFPKPRNLFL